MIGAFATGFRFGLVIVIGLVVGFLAVWCIPANAMLLQRPWNLY